MKGTAEVALRLVVLHEHVFKNVAVRRFLLVVGLRRLGRVRGRGRVGGLTLFGSELLWVSLPSTAVELETGQTDEEEHDESALHDVRSEDLHSYSRRQLASIRELDVPQCLRRRHPHTATSCTIHYRASTDRY